MLTANTPNAHNDSSEQKLRMRNFMQTITASLYQGRYITVDSFDDGILAFVSTRLGGKSKAPFDSFNLALHVGDDKHQVLRNRHIMCDDFGLQQIYFMNQTHSNRVVVVDKSNLNENDFDGDALVTKEKQVGLAVMTADCLPLLLCDEQEQIIAAVHCGWKGLEQGIVEATLEKMEQLGAKRHQIVGYMGPAIGPKSFEVGAEVRDLFIKQNEIFASAFLLKEKAVVKEENGGAKAENSKDITQEAGKVAKTNKQDSKTQKRDIQDTIKVDNVIKRIRPTIGPAPAIAHKLKQETVLVEKEEIKAPVDKYWCDIYKLCLMKLKLSECDGQIFCSGHFDTMQQYPVFYSYRHDYQTGRMATVISITW